MARKKRVDAPPPYQSLDRLEPYRKYKSGTIASWLDPKTNKVYSDWRVRTTRNLGINPRNMTAARKALGADVVRGVMEGRKRIGKEYVNLDGLARSWGFAHATSKGPMKAKDVFKQADFWNDVETKYYGYYVYDEYGVQDVDYDELSEYFDIEDDTFVDYFSH